jgi:hypothetical protein
MPLGTGNPDLVADPLFVEVVVAHDALPSPLPLRYPDPDDAQVATRDGDVVTLSADVPFGRIGRVDALVFLNTAGRLETFVGGLDANQRVEADLVEVVVDVIVQPTGTATGRVTGPDGAPYTNAVVRFEDTATKALFPEHALDVDGVYVIDDLPAGRDFRPHVTGPTGTAHVFCSMRVRVGPGDLVTRDLDVDREASSPPCP